MKDNVLIEKAVTPVLFPMAPEQFLERVREIIAEEVQKALREEFRSLLNNSTLYETPGLTYKPLYKITEVCKMFQVTRTTIYGWVRCGKLKPYKIRSRVYFLHDDVQRLLHPELAEN